MELKQVKLSDLKPSEYNPRKANEKEYKDLKESIRKEGFVDPVIINSAKGRENIIIGGHFRVRVAKDLGIKEVPAVILNIPDIEREKELNLRLNRNTGSWDWDLLANFDADFLLGAGFDKKELDFNLGLFKRPDENFKEMIDKFEPKKTAEENECYFYIEYYKDRKKYAELRALLGDAVKANAKEINAEFFYNLIKSNLCAKTIKPQTKSPAK